MKKRTYTGGRADRSLPPLVSKPNTENSNPLSYTFGGNDVKPTTLKKTTGTPNYNVP